MVFVVWYCNFTGGDRASLAQRWKPVQETAMLCLINNTIPEAECETVLFD
jgi:hypothetical protein